MLLKHLQHVQHPPIYFCSIHNKQLQHTFETTKTLETCICIIGEGKPGPVDSSRRGQSRRRAAAHEHHRHQYRAWLDDDGGDRGRGAPWPPGGGGSSVVEVREGATGGVEGATPGVEGSCPLPCNTAAPPPRILPEESGSRSCSKDLAEVGERAVGSSDVGGSR